MPKGSLPACVPSPPQRFDTAMPALTRKQINEQPERWHIHYAGVRVGQRSGAPPSSNQWEWHCGFYPPGSNPGEQRYGNAVQKSMNEIGRAIFALGGDGDYLHRDLFYHPIFDGGVKSTPPCVT